MSEKKQREMDKDAGMCIEGMVRGRENVEHLGRGD